MRMKLICILFILALFSCKKFTVDLLELGEWRTEHARLSVRSN
jgi:hypothetical protein